MSHGIFKLLPLIFIIYHQIIFLHANIEDNAAGKVGDRIRLEHADIFERDLITQVDFEEGGALHEEITYLRDQMTNYQNADSMIALFDDDFSIYRWARNHSRAPINTLLESFHDASNTLKRLNLTNVNFTSIEQIDTEFVKMFGDQKPLLAWQIKGCDADHNVVLKTTIGDANDDVDAQVAIDMLLFSAAYLQEMIKSIEKKTHKRQTLRIIMDFSNFEVWSLNKYKDAITSLQDVFPELTSQFVVITSTAFKYLLSALSYLLQMDTFTNLTDKVAQLVGNNKVVFVLNLFKHYVGERTKKKFVNTTIDKEPDYMQNVSMDRLLKVLVTDKDEL
uniref:CRAL-TRIO domain-containing protein n=1 Tax=Ditylenchus dipsaci TaxID=166011 RepID=A0A915CMX4_9BILA